MKRFSNRTILSAAVIVLTPQFALADDTATGDEIRTYLSGNTLQGSTGTDPFAEYYDPDGTIRGNGYTAKWKVEGDSGCMDYGKGFDCWSAILSGEGSIWIKEGAADAAGMMRTGNPNNF
ncbi:hypothetical protein [uncultured Roseovarius sp.]|uniref:hypothetical protein n=1 Tax=uncultured Roseovarius sp. TaxID=293344 RepID=UPI002639B373|nr:hypothetical protein [uncultured Roseovarius sp.]